MMRPRAAAKTSPRCLLLPLVWLLIGSSWLSGCKPEVGEIYEAALPGIVTVVMVKGVAPPGPGALPSGGLAQRGLDEEQQQRYMAWVTASMGGGLLLDDEGRIATAAHVLDGADRIGVVFAGNLRVRAHLIGKDPLTDLALLQVKTIPRTARPLPLAPDATVAIGDPVLVVGHPDGLPGTLSHGIISGLHRRSAGGLRVFDDYLQTDAPLFPGSSGGPLLDRRGRVLGLVTSIDQERRGIGFAVPAVRAQPILEQLARSGTVVRGWIGATAKDLDAEVEDRLKLAPGIGAEIWRILPGLPAELAGMKPGDVVVEAAGRTIYGRRDLAWAAALTSPGSSLKLSVLRQGKPHQLVVTVAQRPDQLPEGGKNAF